jgi:hypothetical protein
VRGAGYLHGNTRVYFSKQSIEVLQADYEAMPGRCRALRDAYLTYNYTNDRAREFAIHGFSRRLQMLVHCVTRTFEILPPDLEAPPTSQDRSNAEVNIQAFVFNALGCIDNLAWIWVSERNVTQDDGSTIPNTWVGLTKRNRLVRSSLSPAFRKYLTSREQWFGHLENFRHALAHRIPLYIPPYVILNSDEAAYKELEGRMMRATTRLEYDRLSSEQKALAKFRPCMMHSFGESARPIVFHPQLLADLKTIDELGWKMLEELRRAPTPISSATGFIGRWRWLGLWRR